eukprot:GILJ01005715.1.p1 GENE.GILJ01005715.1~~GILJ01005715.1.p1  ORF type:complete len:241 (-),score=19.27 GILJ01005715.1:133-855(-)
MSSLRRVISYGQMRSPEIARASNTSQPAQPQRPRSFSDVQVPAAGSTKLTEVYGFAAWITSFVTYVIFILWSFLPERILHQLGVTYYPSKYWAHAGPAFFCMLFGFSIFIYTGINLVNTEPLDSFHTFTDQHARDIRNRKKNRSATSTLASDEGIPDISDIPITVINKMLYQQRPQAQSTLRSKTPIPAASGLAPPLSIAGVHRSLLSVPTMKRSVSNPTTLNGLGGHRRNKSWDKMSLM